MNLKIQCPSCRELCELVDFSTSENGISFRCGACGQESFIRNPHARDGARPPGGAVPTQPIIDKGTVAASGKQYSSGTARSSETVCPKCGHSQADSVACHRCGLVFAKYDSGVLPPDPEVAVAAWAALQQNPLSDDAHEAFIQACLTANRLDFGARRYRLMARDPSMQEKAEKMLARLYQVGQARLGAYADLSVGQERPKNHAKVIRWILFVAAAGLFSYFVFKLTDLLKML
jgi:hypothetical protein